KHCTKPPEIVVLLQAMATNATGLKSDLGLASHLVLGHMFAQMLAISVGHKCRQGSGFVIGNALGAGTIAGPKPGHERNRLNNKSWRRRRRT
ncbi:hypothetical protein QR685DRAFT_448907, partial [Neurospora intermedia]